MATIYWEGQATAVAQVHGGAITAVDGTPADNTFTITIGGEAISQVGDTDVATTAAALLVLLNASTHVYFAAITWTNPSAGNIVGTADTAGVPFTAVLTETGAGAGAVTDFSETTASAGPNDWSVAANWSAGAVPVADDDVILRDSSVNVCWGLAQSAVDLDSLVIEATYTGRIGLRYGSFATSSDGETVDTSAPDYRDHYLDIEVDGQVRIGEHYGPGSPVGSQRIKLDLGVQATTVIVHSTSRTTAETGKPCVRLLLASGTSKVYVRSAPGGVGIAVDEPGETSTVSEVNVSDQAGADTVVTVGDGTTITTWTQDGGTCTLQAAATVTLATIGGGTLNVEGAYLITTLTIDGGTIFCNNLPAAGAACTTINLNEGNLIATRSNRARTWTTLKDSVSGATSYDIDPAVVTLTNNVELVS